MRNRSSLVIASCVAVLSGSGCLVPRSMVVGQMAGPVGRGATDVGVFTGVQYASQTNPPFQSQNGIGDPITTQERSAGFGLPAFEANLQYGFNDNVGLNVHASPAGIQPGVKLTVNRSKTAHFAILPQVAFGYGSIANSVFVAGADGVQVETSPTSKTSFSFLGGLKLLVSHKSGFFAGVGYDFLFNRQYSAAIVGSSNVTDKAENITSTIGHQISVGIGMDIALGWVHLRPEICAAVTPGIAQTKSGRVGAMEIPSVTGTGGFGFAIFPGFTLAVASPQREMTAEEEEEEENRIKEEKRRKARRNGGQQEDDEDDDDDEDGKKPTLKKKKNLDDDEEDGPKRPKRRATSDDDED
ncbi:MAG: hypothetical protein U0228_12820 [Myxococcaceae bacterium]